MPKYRIGLTQTVYEGATITIEAKSVLEAEAVALQMAEHDYPEWEFLEAAGAIEIVSIDEV